MTAGDGDLGGRPWPGEVDAGRLFAAVSRACNGREGLPARLEAGLRVVLDMLSADPELAWTLTVDPYLGADDDARDAQRVWIGRFGDLLGDAAAADPRTSAGPFFLAPFLIGGVRFQIARLVLNAEGSDLLRLLPGMLEALLACYFDPDDPRRRVRVTSEDRQIALDRGIRRPDRRHPGLPGLGTDGRPTREGGGHG